MKGNERYNIPVNGSGAAYLAYRRAQIGHDARACSGGARQGAGAAIVLATGA